MPTRRLLPSSNGVLKGEDDGFIPVSKPRTLGASEKAPAYRSIEAAHDDDGDSSSSDDDPMAWVDSDDEDTIDSHSAETARLARILDEDVRNIHSWVNVIKHSASTNPTPAGRADIWINMLQKAINAHPSNRLSDVLRLRYLDAVLDGRPPKELEAAWEKALVEVPSEDIWVEYVGFRLRKDGPQALDEVVARVYGIISKSDLTEESRYFARLRVFWRAATGLTEAGTR